MLRDLAVQNLALIEDVRVELQPGFCAWTGETGAGKSLLLGALGLLLGERGTSELIRAGADELRVTGRFEFTRPEQKPAAEELLQTTLDDDELILTRRLSRSGRSSALVNDLPIAVATLRRLGEMLVDVHGQRDSYSLLQPACQLDLLDSFGKLMELRKSFIAAAENVRHLRKRSRELTAARETRQRETLARTLRARRPRLRSSRTRRVERSAQRTRDARSCPKPGAIHRNCGSATLRRRRRDYRDPRETHQGSEPLGRARRETGRTGSPARTTQARSGRHRRDQPRFGRALRSRSHPTRSRRTAHRFAQEAADAIRQNPGRTHYLPGRARRQGTAASASGRTISTRSRTI